MTHNCPTCGGPLTDTILGSACLGACADAAMEMARAIEHSDARCLLPEPWPLGQVPLADQDDDDEDYC